MSGSDFVFFTCPRSLSEPFVSTSRNLNGFVDPIRRVLWHM